MTRRSKLVSNLTNLPLLETTEKSKLTKYERLKTLETFNQYRKSGLQFIAKQELIKILESLGRSIAQEQLQDMMGSQQTIDQNNFQQIINDYKIFVEGPDDTLFRNAFESLSDPVVQKVQVSHLQKTLLNDFGIDITHFGDQSKFYLNYEEFRNFFA